MTKGTNTRPFIVTIIILALALAASIALSVAIINSHNQPAPSAELGTYAQTAKVVEINESKRTVTFEDFNGFLWEAFCDAEDWAIDDCASLLMDSRGTASVLDDKVVSVRYSGWTLTRN